MLSNRFIRIVIVINSFPTALKFFKFSYILFADDLQLFIQCPANGINSTVSHMTEDVAEVSRWSERHGLRLNAKKTKSILFGSNENLIYCFAKST